MKAKRARLDKNKNAKPLTELRGVMQGSREGTLFAGPGVIHVDRETGKRTDLDFIMHPRHAAEAEAFIRRLLSGNEAPPDPHTSDTLPPPPGESSAPVK